MHTIKSSLFQGAGMVGCGPYGGEDNLKNPYPPEEEIYNLEVFAEKYMSSVVNNITGWARGYEQNNQIDKFSNMEGDRIYVNHAANELTVAPGLAACMGFFYGNLSQTENFNININQKISGMFGHNWPTNEPNFPFEMVQHFYPELSSSVPISSGYSGQIQQFNTGPYCPGGNCETSAHMSNTGYYYAPPACSGGQTCKVIFHLHGCGGSAVEQGSNPTVHVAGSGLLQIADAHGLIVVFPQTMPGCWNHDGNFNMEPSCKAAGITDSYSCLAYLTHENVQVTALAK